MTPTRYQMTNVNESEIGSVRENGFLNRKNRDGSPHFEINKHNIRTPHNQTGLFETPSNSKTMSNGHELNNTGFTTGA